MAGAGQKQRGGGSSKNHWPPSAPRVLSFFGIGILRSGEDEEDFDDEPHGDDDKVDEDALLSINNDFQNGSLLLLCNALKLRNPQITSSGKLKLFGPH